MKYCSQNKLLEKLIVFLLIGKYTGTIRININHKSKKILFKEFPQNWSSYFTIRLIYNSSHHYYKRRLDIFSGTEIPQEEELLNIFKILEIFYKII